MERKKIQIIQRNRRIQLTNTEGNVQTFIAPDIKYRIIPEEAATYYIENNQETHMEFPVLQYPEKVKSLNLEKTREFKGVLKGIKGQYLIFEDNTVFNIRGNEGLYVSLSVS